MLDNPRATIGGNNPPDPIEAVLAEYDGVILEAHNWADGEPVTDDAGMKAVDAVLKEFKRYKSALKDAGKQRTDPLHKAWKAEVAAVKVYADDADALQASLVQVVAPFKAQKLKEQQEAERAAYQAAEQARREAEAKEAQANLASIDERREAMAAKEAALEAQKAAQQASKSKVKGMRTIHHHEIKDMRALVNWIAANDKQAMADFATEYARKKFKDVTMAGVETWTTKEAY